MAVLYRVQKLRANLRQQLAKTAYQVLQAVPVGRLEAEGERRTGHRLSHQGPTAGHFDAHAVDRRLRMLRPRPPHPLRSTRRGRCH